MLYQDQTISKFLSDLRSAISTRSDDGFGLTNMGIKVSNVFSDHGKLEIDTSALEKAFSENPDKIQSFFTDVDKGLAKKVTDAINSAAQTTGATKGSLVRLAGVAKTTADTDNTITKQLQSYKDLIDKLQEKYEDEQERYWKQFTNLETMMSNYNSQSEWLSSQFSQ